MKFELTVRLACLFYLDFKRSLCCANLAAHHSTCLVPVIVEAMVRVEHSLQDVTRWVFVIFLHLFL